MFSWIKSAALNASPIVVGTFLAACGGGSSSDSTSQTASTQLTPGAYLATVAFADGSTDQAGLLLSPSGKFVSAFYYDDISVGTLNFGAADSIDGKFTDLFFDDSWQSVSGEVSGKAVNVKKATLTATAPGVAKDIVIERDDEFSDAGVTLEEITGTYSMSGTDVYTAAVTIAADGTITGSDETGCTFNGTATIPNTKYNVFEVTFEASNCEEALRNGQVSGLGYYESELKEISFVGTDKDVPTVFIGAK